ncbi:MAG: hypothetical protein ACTSRW_09985 [Candidatus Helarchaeota archaeon]
MSKKGKRIRVSKKEQVENPTSQMDKIKNFFRRLWPEKLIRKPRSRLDFEFLTRMELPSPPREVFFILVLLFFLYIVSGGIYNMTRKTIPLNYQQIGDFVQPVFFWKDLHEQFILEGIIFAILLFIVFMGTYLIYESTKNFYRPSTSYAYLVIGLILFFLAFAFIELLIHQKITSFYSPEF